MAKYSVLPAHRQYIDDALKINEELQALLAPLLTAVENEADTDTHLMLRAVQRITLVQLDKLTRLDAVFKKD
ncbi:hypothetical protein Q4R55_12145 [Morganella morganii subsp. sibonii]|nr:hypothetical protein [Morganella morganii]HAS8353584.1 hypothetical protein [Vibrio vulnificus]HCR3555838.1 hypothetical protein [Morganella morganii]HCR3760702.1 hypothetical protein [Morganella morganii]HCR4039661.1 hypothetical protein [Morganella morganii]